jgi:hypothetical protein
MRRRTASAPVAGAHEPVAVAGWVTQGMEQSRSPPSFASAERFSGRSGARRNARKRSRAEGHATFRENEGFPLMLPL